VCAEVKALERQTSNIPAKTLDLRHIAQALGLSEQALPFVGELLEVRSEESVWQGAIERVLHGFALSLLVDDQHYAALSQYVNNINLGDRLVYFRTSQPDISAQKTLHIHSLIHKLSIKKTIYTAWLEAELKQRFDYACVDSLVAFRKEERALTREGMVRQSKSRHEKDDRRQIDDKRYWVLGFDNHEKLALYKKQAQQLAEQITKLDQEIVKLRTQDQARHHRSQQCVLLANMQWQEIDVASLLDRITTIQQQLLQEREGNKQLQKFAEEIATQRKQLTAAEQASRDSEVKQQTVVNTIDAHQNKLVQLKQDAALITLTLVQQNSLQARFQKLNQILTLENLDKLASKALESIQDEEKKLVNECNEQEKIIEQRFAEFKRCWPMEASDMDITLNSAADFFAKLQRLETDGLPAYEQRFFELLQTQSNQNLAALSTYLHQARKAITDRMQLVNESLRQAPFNPGTYLHIEANDRQLPQVREFKQEIQQALAHAWGEDDRESAEARFIILRKLVDRLANQEIEHQRWRESVLDVRQHVEFIGRELDNADDREIQVHRSGSGKSGGERQKLATTCLAAALRYQLGGMDHHVPRYAPVVLDEAFDKADNEFTTLAMNIFVNFGFQMIVATPLKSVMTLEPFIGGACFVDINEQRQSGVLLIEYDADKQRLQLPENNHANATVIS